MAIRLILLVLAIKFPNLTKAVYYLEIIILTVMSIVVHDQSFTKKYLVDSSIIFVFSFYHFLPALILALAPLASHFFHEYNIGNFPDGLTIFSVMVYQIINLTMIQVLSSSIIAFVTK